MSFWVAAIGLPFVAGLHRFAASYGYRRASRRVAFGEAWRVGAIVAIGSLWCAVGKLAGVL